MMAALSSERAAARATSSTATGGATTKVVRSTHGVNCTGSCSWKVFVKDGIITWESQQTDYPSPGPDPSRLGAPRLSPGRGFLLVHLLPDGVRHPTPGGRNATESG
jgi:nitrate reductase alpha subunit